MVLLCFGQSYIALSSGYLLVVCVFHCCCFFFAVVVLFSFLFFFKERKEDEQEDSLKDSSIPCRLQLWPWPWIGMVETLLLLLLTVSMWWTIGQSLMKIPLGVKEILGGQEIKGSNSWPSIATLPRISMLSQGFCTLSLSRISDQNFMTIFSGVKDMWSGHKIKGSNFNYDLVFGFCTSSWWGKHLTKMLRKSFPG